MLCCLSLAVVGVQMFLQLQHTKLQSLQQATGDQLPQTQQTPLVLSRTLSEAVSMKGTCQTGLTVSASSSTVGHWEHDVMTSRELRNWLPILWSLSPRKRTDEWVMELNFLCML